MELHSAFHILGVKPDCDSGELSKAFRTAVKQYHPDFNAERLEWSHEMMTRLNSAYAVAVEHLRRRGKGIPTDGYFHDSSTSSGPNGHSHSRNEGSTQAEQTHAAWSESPSERNPKFDAHFPGYCDEVIEALYLYYQYGLENLHLRNEGNLRFRYRTTLKRLLKAAEKLSHLEVLELSARERLELEGYLRFSLAFLRCAKGGIVFMPSLGNYETKAHRHYNHASRILDNAVKRAFFDNHFLTPSNSLSQETLSLCEQELLIVRGGYAESRYYEDAGFKLRLVERLIFLLKL
ncbi:MAG: J domain-containing protein [Spirochaetaceae bacterium]|nr:MAG: J domain-containing protein [Spirochaetaceae bacterium]